MSQYFNGLCKIQKKDINIINKNPHCASYYCFYKNINNCNKNSKDKIILGTNCSGPGLKFNKNMRNYNKSDEEQLKEFIKKDPFIILKDPKKIKQNIFRNLDNLEYIPYFPPGKMLRSGVHIGQFKLLISEIEFLTKCLNINKYKSKEITIIYAGAASGKHQIILNKMFPNLQWILIDPNKFHPPLYKLNNYQLINELFTDKMAKELKRDIPKSHQLLFISDIRVSTEEEKIGTDMELQKRWYYILNPDFSMLKMRIPRYKKYKGGVLDRKKYNSKLNRLIRGGNVKYSGDVRYSGSISYNKKNNKIDVKEIQNLAFMDKYQYLDGEIYLQCFAPLSSTETRLITGKNTKEKYYSMYEYEGKLNVFNSVYRYKFYPNKCTSIEGIDHCYDCSVSIDILNNYKNKFKFINYSKKSIKNILNEFDKDNYLYSRLTKKSYELQEK